MSASSIATDRPHMKIYTRDNIAYILKMNNFEKIHQSKDSGSSDTLLELDGIYGETVYIRSIDITVFTVWPQVAIDQSNAWEEESKIKGDD